MIDRCICVSSFHCYSNAAGSGEIFVTNYFSGSAVRDRSALFLVWTMKQGWIAGDGGFLRSSLHFVVQRIIVADSMFESQCDTVTCRIWQEFSPFARKGQNNPVTITYSNTPEKTSVSLATPPQGMGVIVQDQTRRLARACISSGSPSRDDWVVRGRAYCIIPPGGIRWQGQGRRITGGVAFGSG